MKNYICDKTANLVPHSYHIGEESIRKKNDGYIAKALKGDCWIIDPIDGTMPYAFGLSTWGISLAFAERGVITEGAMFLPHSGTLVITEEGVAYRGEFGCDPAKWTEKIGMELEPITLPSYTENERGIISISQDSAKYGRLLSIDGVQSVGSCVYSVVQFLLGRYRGMLTHVKLWDIAAGIALLAICNAVILGPDGVPITPVVADMPFELNDKQGNLLGMHGQITVAATEQECRRLMSISTLNYPK